MAQIRVSIQTFGCRVNQYDSEMMRDLLTPDYNCTDEDPDVVILNACTVTALAERKARQAARRIRRQYAKARIVVIGCVADAVDQGTTQFPDADLLAGNSWKPLIDRVVQRALSGAYGTLAAASLGELSAERSHGPRGRIRAFLKIQAFPAARRSKMQSVRHESFWQPDFRKSCSPESILPSILLLANAWPMQWRRSLRSADCVAFE